MGGPDHSSKSISGSQRTGNFTELAMKHMAWALSWSSLAFAASLLAVMVTDRMQRDLGKPARAAGRLLHFARRLVAIGGDDDAGERAQMQIPELVAGRDRSDEQVLRIPARGIAAKGGVGRSRG